MKYVISILKRIIFGFFVLYSFNIISSNFNLVIPINIVTVLIVSFWGFPALFALVLFLILIPIIAKQQEKIPMLAEK